MRLSRKSIAVWGFQVSFSKHVCSFCYFFYTTKNIQTKPTEHVMVPNCQALRPFLTDRPAGKMPRTKYIVSSGLVNLESRSSALESERFGP